MHKSKSHNIHYLNGFADACVEILCMLTITFLWQKKKKKEMTYKSKVFIINIS